jgi:signal transduction histidine kinase
MIQPTQRRLAILFASVIGGFQVLILVLSFVFINHSLMKSMRMHLEDDIHKEFLPHLVTGSLAGLDQLREEEFFQVFDRKGRVLGATHDAFGFGMPVDAVRLAQAFSGIKTIEPDTFNGQRFLVAYFPIDESMAGRGAMPLTTVIRYEKTFITLFAVSFPVTLLASFFISRYLVLQSMKPIEEVFTFQENFSSNVTHELKSPLASLKGNIEVALRKERTAEEYRAALRLGLRETDRIINLLNNLSLLASSKFRPLELLREPSRLKLIIDDVLIHFGSMIQTKKLAVDASRLEDIECLCDESLTRRAIENLIDNAVKYTPDGGTIRISLFQEQKDAVIRIENSCASLGVDNTDDYFQPFYRGEDVRASDVEGKGLGLYIARYIVRSHGGDISLKATDSGTCLVEVRQPAG